MTILNDDLANTIERDGYAVIRGLLSPEEVARMRAGVEKHFSKRGVLHNLGRTQPNAAVEVDGLGWIYSLPAIVDVFRRALRTDDVMFTGHCDIHDSMLSGWHKDSGEHRGGYFRGDYFNADDCKVYKMAIYLDDHDGTGTGLTIKKASHRTKDLSAGEEVALDTRKGDAIIFDVRLTHVGQRPDFVERVMMAINRRFIGKNTDKPDLCFFTRMRGIYARVKGEGKRLSIFFTFGYPNSYTEQFSKSNMTRQLAQTHAREAYLPAATRCALKEAGVRLYAELE
jgi:hypothetical protein